MEKDNSQEEQSDDRKPGNDQSESPSVTVSSTHPSQSTSSTLPPVQAHLNTATMEALLPPAPAQMVAAPRETMIATAMKFLLNPQVQSSPVSQRRAFLQKKGLTEEEINIAIQRSGVTDPIPQVADGVGQHPGQGQVVPLPPPLPPAPRSSMTIIRDYAAVAVLISGITYAIYRLIQKYILPLFARKKEDEERLERIETAVTDLNTNVTAAVKEIEKSVTAMQTLLERQEIQLEQMSKDVMASKVMASTLSDVEATQIKSEISSLKGILLSRHQFPATPQPKSIPQWQRQDAEATPTRSDPGMHDNDDEETPKVKKEDLSHHRVNGIRDDDSHGHSPPLMSNGGDKDGLVNGDVAEEDMNHVQGEESNGQPDVVEETTS